LDAGALKATDTRPGPVTVAVPMVGAPGATALTVNERLT